MSYYTPPPPPPPPAAGPAITPWYRKPGPLFLLGLLIAAAVAIPVLLLVLGGDDDGEAGSTSTTAPVSTTAGSTTSAAETTTTGPATTTTSPATTTTSPATTTTSPATTTTSPATTTTTSGGTLTLDYRLPATYVDQQQLAAGFTPQPWTYTPCSSGGIPGRPWVDVSTVNPDCRGYANDAPDFDIRWSGTSTLLCFYFVANDPSGDATMIVNTPFEEWLCDDDSGDMYNPAVRIDNPVAGGYDIWLGSWSDGANVSGTFYVTDDPTLCPAP